MLPVDLRDKNVAFRLVLIPYLPPNCSLPRSLVYCSDAAECMDLLEEMERQQKGLSDENAVLRTENDSYLSEIERLSAILAAREQELHDLKGVSAAEEIF